jgi:hypothetical protein
MKALIVVFGLLTAMVFGQQAQAQQLELPFSNPQKILGAAYPGDKNVHRVFYDKLPLKIQDAFQNVDLAFEAGDGYYNLMTSAYYVVTDESGNVVGYMEAGLANYTEDPDYFLLAAWMDTHGVRLQKDVILDSWSIDDPAVNEQLPEELRPGTQEHE